MQLSCEVDRQDLIAASVTVSGIRVVPSGPSIKQEASALYARLREGDVGLDEKTKKGVRAVLRNGIYKPSGRGKPASEYLFGVWKKQGELDLINNAVDVNNLVSLRHGVPISAFDAGKIDGDLTLRLGREGEAYVFNAAGQEIKCEDLVVVADARGPIGSPVKDSQATKLFEDGCGVVYVVYGNRELWSEAALEAMCEELSMLLAADQPGASAGEPRCFCR